MNDSNLYKALVRVAHENPGEVREAILPILKAHNKAGTDPSDLAADLIMSDWLPDHFVDFNSELKRARKELDGHTRIGMGHTGAKDLVKAIVKPAIVRLVESLQKDLREIDQKLR
jgi:hypothetical protein